MNVKISASVLNADLANLEKEISRAESCGADLLHLDVMDGVFTDSITFGDYVVKNLRRHSRLPFDVHLMVSDPTNLIPLFKDAGADMITIHEESSCDTASCLKTIRRLGIKAGISVNPETAVEKIFPYLPLCDLVLIMSVKPGAGGQTFKADSYEKIKAVRAEADRLGISVDISVDGGVNPETLPLVYEAGVTIAVVGTFLFKAEDINEAMKLLK